MAKSDTVAATSNADPSPVHAAGEHVRTAPVNRELCLSFIGERVMGLPRSY